MASHRTLKYALNRFFWIVVIGARDETLVFFATELLDRLGPGSSAPDARRSRSGFALRDVSAKVREASDSADEGQ